MDGVENVLPAAFDPFDRAFELDGEVADECLFGIDVEFAAEPAAHFGGDDPQSVLGEVEHDGELRAEQVRDLGGRPEGELAVARLEVGQDTPGFDGVGRKPLVDDFLFDDPVRLLQGRVNIAPCKRPGEGLVGFKLFVQERGVRLEGVFCGGDGG